MRFCRLSIQLHGFCRDKTKRDVTLSYQSSPGTSLRPLTPPGQSKEIQASHHSAFASKSNSKTKPNCLSNSGANNLALSSSKANTQSIVFIDQCNLSQATLPLVPNISMSIFSGLTTLSDSILQAA